MSGADAGAVLRVVELPVIPLSHESFAPFGDVLRERPGQAPITNSTFMERGNVRGIEAAHAGTPQFEVLDYWPDLAALSPDPLKVGLLRPRQRPPVVTLLERHRKGTQAFIPLHQSSSVIVVGPDSGCDDPQAQPDPEALRAFELKDGVGVNLFPGTWHWTPFPLSDPADLLILVRRRAADDDLHFFDLEGQLRCRAEVALETEGTSMAGE